jgi:hypothetical protein
MAKHLFKPGSPKPANSGRKKGTPNKKTKEFMQLLQDENFDPAKELIRCYREARAIFELRKRNGNLVGAMIALGQASDTAGDLAQYSYPKKKAIEHSGEIGVKTFADFIEAGSKAKKE